MTVRLPKSALVLSLLALPALLPAQTSGNEEERMQALTRADTASWYLPRNKVTIGFRMLTSGAQVNFGNLGNVAYDLTVAPASDGEVDRVYDNGAVRTDFPRLAERAGDPPVQTSTPGGRYQTFATITEDVLDGDGNVIGTQDVVVQTGDFLSFTPGLTRNWGYGANSQATADGRMALSTYSATSDGASILMKEGPSAGLEFTFTHTLGRGTGRTQWGLMAGVTLNGINSKSAGSVAATLHARTDYYSLNGATAPAAPYLAPSFVDFTASDGTVTTDGLETTVPLATVPASSTETATPGGATVNGNWQVKGAYFMVRLGPTVHSQLTPRLGVNASVGFAAAYAGSTYSVYEAFAVPDLADVLVGARDGTAYDYAAKYLNGYYADLNVEWAANERTGLFGGITAQKFDAYDQAVGGRTARIDLGSTVGIRGGVSIRF